MYYDDITKIDISIVGIKYVGVILYGLFDLLQDRNRTEYDVLSKRLAIEIKKFFPCYLKFFKQELEIELSFVIVFASNI